MDIKKLAPWNWFKKENNGNGHTVPVRQSRSRNGSQNNGLDLFHDEMDRVFDAFFQGFGLSPLRSGTYPLEGMTGSILKPRLDLGATDTDYTVSIEIPGVSEKDVSLELAHDTLMIRGEKKQEKEEKNKSFYRLKRSYGSFQRILSLPEDADKDKVNANFNNGVLKITIPRISLPGDRTRQIKIKAA